MGAKWLSILREGLVFKVQFGRVEYQAQSASSSETSARQMSEQPRSHLGRGLNLVRQTPGEVERRNESRGR